MCTHTHIHTYINTHINHEPFHNKIILNNMKVQT